MGPVTEIVSTTESDCPNYQFKVFEGNWPGTVTGCDCLKVKKCSNEGVKTGKLTRGTCNTNSTSCGCTQIRSLPANPFWDWPLNNKFCAERDPRITYQKVYSNLNINGSCNAGTKSCGKSKYLPGICIPASYNCPLTSLLFADKNPDAQKYTEITGNGTNLYYSSMSDFGGPLVDLVLRENKVCLDPKQRSLTPGREDYTLMNPESDGKCEVDSRFKEVGQDAGELDLMKKITQYLLPLLVSFCILACGSMFKICSNKKKRKQRV